MTSIGVKLYRNFCLYARSVAGMRHETPSDCIKLFSLSCIFSCFACASCFEFLRQRKKQLKSLGLVDDKHTITVYDLIRTNGWFNFWETTGSWRTPMQIWILCKWSAKNRFLLTKIQRFALLEKPGKVKFFVAKIKVKSFKSKFLQYSMAAALIFSTKSISVSEWIIR